MRYRAELSAYIVLATIFGGMTAFATYEAFAVGRGMEKLGVILGAVFVFVLAWLASFEIRIDEQELSFRALFSGERRIRHVDIRKIRLAFETGNGLQGPLRLIIEPTRDSGVARFSINAKVFSREAIQAVLELGRRVATADDGGLVDGLVMKHVRDARKHRA